MGIQRNFRTNLEIGKNHEKCVKFNFQKKGKRHKTQEKKESFLTNQKYSVHNGNIYHCAKSCMEENEDGVFVSHL